MHVAIDVSPLESDHKNRGIGSYTDQLIEALKKHKSEHSFSFFTRGQIVPKNADLVHYPYFDPFFLTLPLLKPKPTVVTVHDLIPIAFPKHFPRGLRGEFKWQIQKFSLKSSAAIITDSLRSKHDVVRLTEFSKEKIHVVRLAPASAYQIKKNKKLRFPLKRYILYVGDVNWNKNIPGLLRAVANVGQKENVDLVLVGKQFLNSDLSETGVINSFIRELSLKTSIKKLGYVSDSDLAALYSNASVYVQPSFAEGFGFPILEAMACGCPVICANTPSLNEIAGPAKLVDPHNSENMAKAILAVLNFTKIERESVVNKGLQWVKNFSWDKVAEETIRVYESIVA